jgi:putative oxidoreductase
MTNQIETYAAPLGRMMLALIFVLSGFQKITGYEGTQGYMEMMGVPGGLLPLVILTELGGGLALALGWQTRIAAFLLAGFTLLSGLLFHFLPSLGLDGMEAQMQMIMFLKNVSITGGLLFIVALGAGPLSLDRRAPAALAA